MERFTSYSKEFKNASWIIACRIVQFGLNFIVSLLAARYLGPERYGLTSYAASVSAFFIPVALMGLSDTLVRELSDDPENGGKILGTSLVISAFASILGLIGMSLTAYVLNRDDRLTVLFCVLYSISLLFQHYEIIACWFQLNLMSKYTAISTLIAFAFSSAYKLYLLASEKSIVWFSATSIIDFGLISVILLLFYLKNNGPRMSFSFKTASKLLARSKYYVLINIIVASFSAVDKIILKRLVGGEANGLYSAAYSIAASTAFVYSAIIESFRPSIVSLAGVDKNSFENRIKTLFSVVIWVSVLQNIVFSSFGGIIIRSMLGETYIDAIPAFRILTWFTTFSYLGSARNVWVLSNNNQKHLLLINTFGAVSGLVINMILIRSFGIIGASVTAVIIQFITNFVTGFLFTEIKPVNRLILESLNPVYAWKFAISILKEYFNKSER